jgi:MFS transporter, CP family, cyanate transporter
MRTGYRAGNWYGHLVKTQTTKRFLLAGMIMLPAILFVSVNLRGPIVSPSPVLGIMQDELEMSGFVAGLLTSIPVLCFALATPLAAALIRRAGANRAVVLTLLGVLAGTLVRSAGTAEAALLGTVIIGVAITIGNVAVPVIIRREFRPSQIGMVTGSYTAGLNLGSLVTALLTAPLAAAFGWQVALAGWSILALLALLVWSRATRAHPHKAAANDDGASAAGADARQSARQQSAARQPHGPGAQGPGAWRRPIAWVLTVGFGGQAFAYYGMTAWLPSLLGEVNGMSVAAAGASSSLFQIFGVVGALGVPLLAARLPLSAVAGVVGALWLPLPLGLLLAPSAWALWCSFGGTAQGGGITVIFIAMMRLATSDREAGGLSALVQGGGYGIGAFGPLIVGSIRDASGNWTWPLLAILAGTLTMAAGAITGGWRADRAIRRSKEPQPGDPEPRDPQPGDPEPRNPAPAAD